MRPLRIRAPPPAHTCISGDIIPQLCPAPCIKAAASRIEIEGVGLLLFWAAAGCWRPKQGLAASRPVNIQLPLCGLFSGGAFHILRFLCLSTCLYLIGLVNKAGNEGNPQAVRNLWPQWRVWGSWPHHQMAAPTGQWVGGGGWRAVRLHVTCHAWAALYVHVFQTFCCSPLGGKTFFTLHMRLPLWAGEGCWMYVGKAAICMPWRQASRPLTYLSGSRVAAPFRRARGAPPLQLQRKLVAWPAPSMG